MTHLVMALAFGASPEDIAFFERAVRPVLAARCLACHSTRTKRRGGLSLDGRAALQAGGDSGPAAAPGAPDKSLLIQAVRHTHATLAMPPKGKLPAAEVRVLEEWVRRGLPYPGPSTAPPKPGVDIAAGKKFWSIAPAKAHAPPAVRDGTWARRRVDAFLLAGMEKQGLKPSPLADKRTFIRRLSFDLTGLPPTPEEVEAFVGDSRPDAYERLAERLLASPRHGERWGRMWLDLARYCDVAEDWADAKGARWLYRDWVVRALNEDRPYDEFVRRQLAADLMGGPPEEKAALGFLGISPNYWKELKLDHVQIKGVVAEEWEERIHTIGSTFLGLTVACARCHDHKFDPITTRDYYALAGVLASVRQADLSLLPEELDRPAREARARLAKIAKVKTKEAQEEARRLRATPHLNAPMVPGVMEASLYVLPDGPHRTKLDWRKGAQDVALQIRGNPGSPGPAVPRRFLAVLSPGEPRHFSKENSGRLELARAITTDAKWLAARVMVNRVWQHHFGRGLVTTPSDFGSQGDRPTHPELLDDLAVRFVESGWSLKWLHREIVLSSAYRQSSRATEGRDPGNRWLARMPRRRLEVEAWRDAILTVGTGLDDTVGGPPVPLDAVNNGRRTIYASIKRRELPDLLRLNDAPDATTHSPSRTPTTTPLQQLFVLNSPFMRRQAAALATRLAKVAGGGEARIRRAYPLLYGRPATDAEVRLGLELLEEAGPGGWAEYAQVLLASNEFLYID